MSLINSTIAKDLTDFARQKKELLLKLQERIKAAAKAGEGRIVVQLEKTVDVPTDVELYRTVPRISNSMRLRNEALYSIIRAIGDKELDLHASAMEQLAWQGFLVEAETTQAHWADQLQLAPVMDGWRICWEAPSSPVSEKLADWLVTADNAYDLLELPRKLEGALALVSKQVERAARDGDSCAYIRDESWSMEMLMALRNAVQKEGYATFIDEERESLRVSWS